MKKVFLLIIFTSLFLSSCGSSPVAPTANANIAQAQTQTAAPTNTPTPISTSTLTPTFTPTISPTPLGGGSVIAFVAQGAIVFGDLTTNDISYFTIPDADRTDSNFRINFFSLSLDSEKIAFTQSICPPTQPGQTRTNCARELFTSNIDGSNVAQITNVKAVQDPAWSPDGTKIAFAKITPPSSSDLYVVNADGGNLKRLTEGGGLDLSPAWSPDGKKIAFSSQRVGHSKIYIMNSDGSGVTYQLPCFKNTICFSPSWSPDGLRIAFTTYYTQSETSDIYVMDADGSNQINFTAGKYSNASDPIWSPDGMMLAFICDQYICTIHSDTTNIIEMKNLPSIYENSSFSNISLSWFLP